MANGGVLTLHCGARRVEEGELEQYLAPQPQGRWYPIAHSRVLQIAKTSLAEAGYEIQKMELGVTKEGNRFFGVMNLASQLVPGVCLAIGIRSSVDKSFPLGFCAGQRVFCCDNLAFRSELIVKKRHTLNGERNFVGAIAGAVSQLAAFKEVEARRIEQMKELTLTADHADSLILRAYEREIIGARDLPWVLREWRNPGYPEFQDRTIWTLFNAFTSALSDRAEMQPVAYAQQTMRLNQLLLPAPKEIQAVNAA